uniref:G protein-activated inward rectifier potassium channel 3 n=1 Tax=Macrostomum lignano TaxID=282301 RepID=A0A1I8IW55_9PLAT
SQTRPSCISHLYSPNQPADGAHRHCGLRRRLLSCRLCRCHRRLLLNRSFIVSSIRIFIVKSFAIPATGAGVSRLLKLLSAASSSARFALTAWLSSSMTKVTTRGADARLTLFCAVAGSCWSSLALETPLILANSDCRAEHFDEPPPLPPPAFRFLPESADEFELIWWTSLALAEVSRKAQFHCLAKLWPRSLPTVRSSSKSHLLPTTMIGTCSGSDSTRSPSGGGRAFSVQPVASSGSPPAAAAAASTKADDLKPLPNLPHYTVTGASQADNRLRQFAHNLFMFRRKSADGLENDSVPMDGAGRAAGNADTGAAAATSRRRLAVSTKSWRDMKAKSTRRYKRLVFKNGECNISHYNIKKRKRRFLADIFTTLVDIKWRYALLLFTVGFIASWLFFSLFWLLICFSHGDLDEKKPKNFVPCVENVNGFTDALLFSIETQHTIGYGFRYPSDRCPEAVLMVMVQSCFGVIIQALMTGLVFAKLSRPKKRAETLMFSKNAVICKRDGQMVLLFRVGDMRKSQLLEAHVRGILIKKRITREGEVLPLEQFDIDLGYGEGYDRLFLVWPIIVEHKITKDSPFWEISSGDLLSEQFELIVILEGIIESTGMTTQARSSYLPSEIRWGHRFERLITYQKDNGEYQINYEKFHATREIPRFPRCSAKDLADLGEENFPYQGMIDDDQYSLASRTVTSASNLHSMILPKQQSTRDQESAPLHQRKSAGGASTSEPGAGYTAVARSTAMPANSRPEISVRFNEPPQSSTQNSNHSPTAADAKPPPPAAVRRVRPHTAAAAAGPSCGAPFLDAQGNRTQPSRDPQHPSSAAGPANTTMTGLRRKKRKKRRPKTALGIEQQQQQTTSSSAAAGANGAAGGSEPNFPTLNPRVFHALRGFLTTESLKKTKFYSDREERMSSRRLQLDEQSERLKQRIGGFYQKLDSFIAETNKAAQWEPEDRRKQKSFLDDLDNLKI